MFIRHETPYARCGRSVCGRRAFGRNLAQPLMSLLTIALAVAGPWPYQWLGGGAMGRTRPASRQFARPPP